MTETTYHSLDPLRLVSFVFTCLQSLMKSQWKRILNFIRSFAHNWLEIPFNISNELIFSSHFLKNHDTLPTVNSENGSFLSSKREFQGEFRSYNNVSMWKFKDAKKLKET